MQRVAAPSANFCAGSSTKAPPLTAPCQIGRTQARRAGGFAAVGGGLRPPPKPALRAGCPAGLPHPAPACGGTPGAHPAHGAPARFLQGAFPRPLPPARPLQNPLCPSAPASSASPCRVPASGRRPSRPEGGTPRRLAPGRRLRRRACGPPAPFPPHRCRRACGPPAPFPPHHCRRACGPPACPFLNPSSAPKPKPPTLPLGKPGACTFLHINGLTAPRFGLRPAAPDNPACSGGRRRPRRRNTPPAPPWPPGRHGRPRTPSQ